MLTNLSLSHNTLSELPDSMCALAELKTLDVTHNKLSQLPQV